MEKKQNWCYELIEEEYRAYEPEFVGTIPIRHDIEVLSTDEPKQLKLGWVVHENIGIGIVNTRALDPFRLLAIKIKDFCFEHSSTAEMREYVGKMLIKHPEFAGRIRDTIIKVCPQYKEMIEKFIVLI